jgi:two-component system, OmpR family, sensor kinase
MKPLIRNLLLALIPLLLALIGALLFQNLVHPLPVLVFRVDPGTLVIAAGFFISLVWVAAVLGQASAERSYNRRLREAGRAQSESHRRFLRRLDHELKNPLTGMRAALANLNEDLPAEERERAVDDLRRQTERLSRLVNDLRKLAELEDRPLERVQVDVGELLEETVDAAVSLPAYAGRSVHVVISNVPWPIKPVTGDRDLLGLAFYNLVENALKYTCSADAVEVRAREEGPDLLVEVADSGPGIPEEDQWRIFEELFRGANARGIEGSGLGLALVQRILSRHGGSISVRSRQDGQKGTVFLARLPYQAH